MNEFEDIKDKLSDQNFNHNNSNLVKLKLELS